MSMFDEKLQSLEAAGNLRKIPADRSAAKGIADFSSNDYLGFGSLRLADFDTLLADTPMTSSASRLLASSQLWHNKLEEALSDAYGRSALLFNSGWHANTGILPALSTRRSLILADKLVHASIIDGMQLSRAIFKRFAHNDFDHLKRLLADAPPSADIIWIVVESVYSMDGDSPDLQQLVQIKQLDPRVMLYVDEAHAVGVLGPRGLGLCATLPDPSQVDVVVGTMGKALASMGAYAIVSPQIKSMLINTSRSLIFSTALPPMQARWSLLMWQRSLRADSSRSHLRKLSERLAQLLGSQNVSHIGSLIVGDAHKAVECSKQLERQGIVALPIRTPTVPPGTERLRFSLSASMTMADLDRLEGSLR